MRKYHRWIGLVVSVFFLLIAGSGAWIQFVPDKADEIVATRLSDAAIQTAFDRTLAATEREAPGSRISSILMNVSGEQPRVLLNFNTGNGSSTQLMLDKAGHAITDVNALHGWLLTFHKTLMLGTGGQWLSVAAGLCLIVLCVTATVIYIRLLRAQRRLDRRSPFWGMSKGRLILATHRWFGTVIALFLCVLAFTGIWMQLLSIPTGGSGIPQSPPTLSRTELQNTLATSLAAARQIGPDGNLGLLMFDLQSPRPMLSMTYESQAEGLHDLNFDLKTGERLPPRPGLYFLLLRIHRGDLIGESGVWLNIFCGIGLLTLTITGLVFYLHLYRQRLQIGRRAVFWS